MTLITLFKLAFVLPLLVQWLNPSKSYLCHKYVHYIKLSDLWRFILFEEITSFSKYKSSLALRAIEMLLPFDFLSKYQRIKLPLGPPPPTLQVYPQRTAYITCSLWTELPLSLFLLQILDYTWQTSIKLGLNSQWYIYGKGFQKNCQATHLRVWPQASSTGLGWSHKCCLQEHASKLHVCLKDLIE